MRQKRSRPFGRKGNQNRTKEAKSSAEWEEEKEFSPRRGENLPGLLTK
jgi:hypothetical protein